MEYAAFHREGQSSTSYRRIGFGFCGSVWSNSDHEVIDSTPTAIKRENGGPGRSLFNDFDIHTALILAYEDCAPQIRSSFRIPKCHGFVPGSHSGWNTTKVLGRFPSGYTSCNILITQRIPPVTEKPDRQFWTGTVCSHSLTGLRPTSTTPTVWFAHIWDDESLASANPNLWILDFDCCKRMSMDEQGVQQGAEAFLQNDPFYPRPGKDNEEDKELWGYFRAAYEEASSFISQTDSQVSERRPRLLMDTIERIVQDRKLSS
ncbi:putative DUF3669 domain-containing protein [Seiridium cardinale]|uniref:DUF3669 domain-containing protein n=1 Tax=Seiridium cardinale TaxID=138064 RepID=A0ABR2Y362_9PEZI